MRGSKIAALASCSQPAQGPAEAFDIETFAQEFLAAEKTAFEQGDFAALEKLEHPDVKYNNINGTVYDGREAHLAAIREFREAFGGALGEGETDVSCLIRSWLAAAPRYAPY